MSSQSPITPYPAPVHGVFEPQSLSTGPITSCARSRHYLGAKAPPTVGSWQLLTVTYRHMRDTSIAELHSL